jgi:hypothetical protein
MISQCPNKRKRASQISKIDNSKKNLKKDVNVVLLMENTQEHIHIFQK